MQVHLAAFNPFGSIGGTTTAGTATLTKPDGARDVLIQCTQGTVRYTVGGTTAPSGTVGFQLRQGDEPRIVSCVFGSSFQFCAEAGTVTLAYQWAG